MTSSTSSRRECSQKSLTLARKYRSEGKLARAFAHYLVHWHLGELIGSNQYSCSIQEIKEVLHDLTNKLVEEDRISDLISTYHQAIEVFNDEEYNFQLALLYIKQGSNGQALDVLKSCQGLKAKNLRNTVKANILPRWHFAMLNDSKRNEAFEQALAQIVRPNDKVIDIGNVQTVVNLIFILYTRCRSKLFVYKQSSLRSQFAKNLISIDF